MFKTFKNSIITTNKSIILVTPLVLFCTILSVYYNFLYLTSDSAIKHAFSVALLFLITASIAASWLYMMKKGLQLSRKIFIFDKERNDALIEVFKSLLKGFGKLFLPISSYIGLNIIFFASVIYTYSYLAARYTHITKPLGILTIFTVILLSFFTQLWIPEIVYNKKNVLISLYNAARKNFIYFKENLILYIVIVTEISAILLLFYYSASNHPLLSFIFMLMMYYIILHVIVLLFTYYEAKYLEK